MADDARYPKPVGSFGILKGKVEIFKIPFPGTSFKCQLPEAPSERIQVLDSKGNAFGYLDDGVRRKLECIAARSSELLVKTTGICQTDTPKQPPGHAWLYSSSSLVLFVSRASLDQILRLPGPNDFLFLDILRSFEIDYSAVFQESEALFAIHAGLGTRHHIKIPYQISASENTTSVQKDLTTQPVETSQTHNQERDVNTAVPTSPRDPSSITAKEKAKTKMAERIAKVKEKLVKKEVDELSDILEKKGPDKPAAWLREVIEEVLEEKMMGELDSFEKTL